jgi:hypothetical protein
MKAKCAALLVAICILAGLWSTKSNAATQNLILNGDFSTGDFTDWGDFATANGAFHEAVSSFDVTGSGASLAAAFVTGQNMFVAGDQQGGGITQFFTTAGPVTGTLSADFAASNTSGVHNLDGGTITVYLDGKFESALDISGGIDADTTVRSSFATSVILAPGTHELEISITRAFQQDPSITDWVDNVAFDVPVAATTPLPAALPLFATGIGAMGFIGWRRKRKAQAVA